MPSKHVEPLLEEIQHALLAHATVRARHEHPAFARKWLWARDEEECDGGDKSSGRINWADVGM